MGENLVLRRARHDSRSMMSQKRSLQISGDAAIVFLRGMRTQCAEGQVRNGAAGIPGSAAGLSPWSMSSGLDRLLAWWAVLHIFVCGSEETEGTIGQQKGKRPWTQHRNPRKFPNPF